MIKRQTKPGRCGRVVSASACQVGGLWFKCSILPLLKHACGKSDRLLCWLYTPAEMSHQRWISENVYHLCLRKVWIRQNQLWLWNPEEMSSEVQNRGISGSKNGHVSNKNLKKIKIKIKRQTTREAGNVLEVNNFNYIMIKYCQNQRGSIKKVLTFGSSLMTGHRPVPVTGTFSAGAAVTSKPVADIIPRALHPAPRRPLLLPCRPLFLLLAPIHQRSPYCAELCSQ